jgi:signal peptidase II
MSIFIITLLLLDQLVKIYVSINKNSILIKNFIDITYIENYRGAFGLGGSNTLFFIIITGIVIGIILKFIISQKDRLEQKTIYALSFILAGAIGNLIDRLFRGFVIDYIDIRSIMRFPVFNLADIYIVCGWIFLVIVIGIYTFLEKGNK